MDITVVTNQVLMLFIPVVVGYIIARLKVVDGTFSKNLSSFIFNVTLPCAIVSAMQVDFNKEILIKSGLLILISVAIVFLGWIFGIALAKILGTKDFSRRVVMYSMMFSNFSFMGYPVVSAFMGAEGLLYATMFTLPLYITVQSWGVALIDGGGNRKFKPQYILNAPLVAAVLGFILFLTGFRLTGAIDGTVRMLGSTTTPLAMTVVGLALTTEPLKKSFSGIRYYGVALVRLVVFPLFVFYLLKGTGLDISLCQVATIITMMPVAANIIVTSATFGKDPTDPARSVLLSTLLSVVTIPLVGLIIF